VSPVELGAEMATALMALIPEFEGSTDEDFRSGLVLSCAGNLSEIWKQLGSGAATDRFTPPADATAWAHELVHRGMPLAAMLRAYRLGHAFAARRVEQAAAEIEMEPEIRLRALSHASRYFFAYVDEISTQLVTEYEQERARWIRGAAAARAELMTAIIDGQPVDARAATATLRYDVTRRHLAFIVWSEARLNQPAPATGSLEVASTSLARELGGGPVLLVPIGERVVWGWTSGGELRDDADAASVRPGDGLRAAIGTPASGVAGMAQSHDRALAARRVAEVLGVRPGTIVRYGSVALTALLTIEPAEAASFAERQLGELAGDSDMAARLRATLRVYLEENFSPARAARRLGIHQNTVVYRIKRAEEILGHTVDQGRLELEVSLRLSEGLEGLRSAGERRRRDHISSPPLTDQS
jgi:hypothetical protein